MLFCNKFQNYLPDASILNDSGLNGDFPEFEETDEEFEQSCEEEFIEDTDEEYQPSDEDSQSADEDSSSSEAIKV